MDGVQTYRGGSMVKALESKIRIPTEPSVTTCRIKLTHRLKGPCEMLSEKKKVLISLLNPYFVTLSFAIYIYKINKEQKTHKHNTK